MRVLSARDINSLVKKAKSKNENINVFAGKGNDRQIILKKGFKIKHVPSGLLYTVLKVVIPSDGTGPKILCRRPGKKLLIPSSQFKNYERQ
tara:strand:- start:511 stop:783 length:273 start_codon:yes stop_codon:yes gene_type:complete